MSTFPQIKRTDSGAKFGFTLVELLIVIALIGLVSAMLAQAMSGTLRQARERRGKGELLNYGQMLQSRMNAIAFAELKNNPSSISSSAIPSGLGMGPTINRNELTSNDRLRTDMLARRDFARMALPECRADLLYPPATLQYRVLPSSGSGVSARALKITPPPYWDQMRTVIGLRTAAEINDAWASLKLLPASPATSPFVDSILLFQTNANFRKICSERIVPDPYGREWDRKNESAECLYLILSTAPLNDKMWIDLVPARNIGDTDNDGVPEILDPWGVPVAFIRSPIGLKGRGFGESSSSIDPDPFDFVGTDFRYQNTNPQFHPFYVPPAVISAGQDGEFGIRTPESIPDDYYSSSAVQLAGPPTPLRFNGSVFRYPDPFFDVSTLSSSSNMRTLSWSGQIVDPIFSSTQRAKSGGGIGSTLDVDSDPTDFINHFEPDPAAADNLTSIDSDI